MSQHPRADESSIESSPFAATVAAGPLRAALDAVAAVVEECVLQVDSGGISVAAAGPAEVAMVDLDLPAGAFDAYEVAAAPDGATERRLGVDLERLRGVVGMADRDEPVRLALEEATRTLHLGVGELAYTLGLIDPDAIRSPPEGLDVDDQLSASVTLAGADLARCVDAADMVADHVALGVDVEDSDGVDEGDPDGNDPAFYARAEGDTDAVDVELSAEECVALEPGDAHSLFSVDYLDRVSRVVPADADVEVRLGREAPLELRFALGEGSVEYLLAPRRVAR